MAVKDDKQIIRRKKFVLVDIPVIKSKIELIGNSIKDVDGRTIKLDLTRQLKGKSVEMTVRVKLEGEKAVAYPFKLRLLSYFIRRMIRKRISYVEDSFLIPSQESMVKIKPFLITKRRVSRRVRKSLRNKTNNWITDYISERTNKEIFNDITLNKMQKSLSLYLKKTYPLSLCEIRVLEIGRALEKHEIPKIDKSKKPIEIESGIDQLKEIEEERIKEAQEEIKKTQEKASKVEESEKVEEEKEIKEAEAEIEKEVKEEKKAKKVSKNVESKVKEKKEKSFKKEKAEKLKKPKKTSEEKEEEKKE